MTRTSIVCVLLILLFVCCSCSSCEGRSESSRRARAHHQHTANHSHHHHHHHKYKHHAERSAHRRVHSSDLPPSSKPPPSWSIASADPAVYTGSIGDFSRRPQSPLPEEWDWCNTPEEHRSFCTSSWNQHIPEYCGSCYVHGALHAANDRIKLLLDGHHDLQLARQVILNCAPSVGLGAGCDGGETYDVFEFMYRYGLPDESCQNYVARAKHNDPTRCDLIDICMNCMPDIRNESRLTCWEVNPPIKYYIKEYGFVSGEEAIMTEIYERGPITCAFASVDDFDYNYRGGIYIDHTNASDSNHDVEVVGWGIEKETGLKYWKARNSCQTTHRHTVNQSQRDTGRTHWSSTHISYGCLGMLSLCAGGTYWGENSFFRIIRGVNNMRFEEECVFGVFDVSELEEIVVDKKKRGSMFGLVKEEIPKVTEVDYKDGQQNRTGGIKEDKSKGSNHARKGRPSSAGDRHLAHHGKPDRHATVTVSDGSVQTDGSPASSSSSPVGALSRARGESVGGAAVGDRSLPPHVRDNEYWKEKYGRRDDADEDDGDASGDSTNVNLNLNLNLNFKHGQPIITQVQSEVKQKPQP